MDTTAGLYVRLLLLLCHHVPIRGLGHILATHSNLNYTEDERLHLGISELLKQIRMVFDYDYIVLWRQDDVNKCRDNCILDSLIENVISEPLMVSTYDSKKNILSCNHTKRVLLMSCWQKFVSVDSAEHSAIEFPFKTCHLIWAKNTSQMNEICAAIPDMVAFRHFIVNRKYLGRHVIHTCHHGEPEGIDFTGIRDQIRREFFYMKGLPIVTEADQLLPRSILSYDIDGKLQLDGFVGHCITSFAKRHDAKLIITPPLKLGKATYYELVENKTLEGRLDLPAIVSPLKVGYSGELYSYPLELMEYCYMIPVPRLMEMNRVFTSIVESKVLFVIVILSLLYGALITIGTGRYVNRLTFTNIFLNDKSIRGLLGQSFVMPAKPSLFMQYVCFLLCYTSLIIATTYEAYLQSHLIHPSLGKQLESYKDIREAGLKIAISSDELSMFSPATLRKHRDLFKKISSFDDFLKLRARMDTRYVYPVSNSRWQVFHQQQQLFQRPLFYYAKNLCVLKLMLLSVPFRPNLPYKALFNQHMLDVRATGLLQYWINDNFFVMVRLKYMHLSDLSTPEKYADAMVLKDLKWIWIIYATLMALSVAVFVGETIFYRTHTRLKKSCRDKVTKTVDASP